MDEIGLQIMRDPLLRPAREQHIRVRPLVRRRQARNAEILVLENSPAFMQLGEHIVRRSKRGDALDRTKSDLLNVRHGSPLRMGGYAGVTTQRLTSIGG